MPPIVNLSTPRSFALYVGTSSLLAAAWLSRAGEGLWSLNAIAALYALVFMGVWVGKQWQSLIGWSSRNLLLGIAFGLLLILVTQVGAHGLLPRMPVVLDETRALYGVLDAAQGAWHVIPTILSTAVAEELVYRGVVLSWCERRMSLRSAILCSSVLYALPLAASGSWLLFVLGLCLGTLWSVARVATHGLLVPFLAHGLWSLTTFVVMPLVL